LQSLIENFEALMDEGLALMEAKDGKQYGVELDLDGLLRMDTATQFKTIGEGIKAGFMAPNEGRRKLDLPPVKGGQTPYLQQQNYSLAELDERAKAVPPAGGAPPPPPPSPAPADPGEGEGEEGEGEEPADARSVADEIIRRAGLAIAA
jgi:hypothetical protein